MNWFASGVSPTRVGNAHMNVCPYAVFPCADGWFILAVGNDGQFRRFCDALGLPEMRDDPRFATNAGRLAFKELLFAGIEAATSLVPKLELLARLETVGVPAGPINTVAQAFDDPQVISRGMAIDVARPDGSSVPGLRTPIRFSEAELATGRAAPMLPRSSS